MRCTAISADTLRRYGRALNGQESGVSTEVHNAAFCVEYPALSEAVSQPGKLDSSIVGNEYFIQDFGFFVKMIGQVMVSFWYFAVHKGQYSYVTAGLSMYGTGAAMHTVPPGAVC